MHGEQQEVDRPHCFGLIDLDGALERVGGDEELLCEAAQLFLDTCDESFTAVVDAAEAGDSEALTGAAHALKGAVRSFGAEEAQEAALRLEMMGRNHQVEDLRQPLVALRQALDRLRPVMGRLAHAFRDGMLVREVELTGCGVAR